MTKHDAFNAIGYGLGLIHLERVRQVDKHGFDPEADQQYSENELRDYARYWLTLPEHTSTRTMLKHSLQKSGGWGDEWFKYDERTPEERLARAGALIAAEIDRLRYANKLNTTESHEAL